MLKSASSHVNFISSVLSPSRDLSTVTCLCAFFHPLSNFYVPFYVKNRKIPNFMCLLEFQWAKGTKAHSRVIPVFVMMHIVTEVVAWQWCT